MKTIMLGSLAECGSLSSRGGSNWAVRVLAGGRILLDAGCKNQSMASQGHCCVCLGL